MRQTRLDEFLELEEQNKELEKKVEQEVLKNRQKDQLLFQQSKMASLGEMLGNIAHQWRQPLMEISSLFIPVEGKLKMGKELDNKEVLEAISRLNEITKYMSNTITDFKEFFSTNKEKVDFKLSEQINLSLNILKSTLKENNINIEIIVKKNPTIFGYKNEYSQVLINLISNAKDMLILRKIKSPLLKITIDEENNNALVYIEDNAKGIIVKPMCDIFKPFFTKEKKNGTGIGLFMSKHIIENSMNGQLSANNTKTGAVFKIITPKK